jgi:electron transport complex protein RnfG
LRDILKYGVILMVVAAVSAGALAIVNKVTEEKRKSVVEEERRSALLEVLPQAEVFKPVMDGDSILYYVGYKSKDKGNVAGYACVAEGKGYSSTIKTMVGITREGVITGLKILSQRETPGLGARIEEIESSKSLRDTFRKGPGEDGEKAKEKPWFQAQFAGKKPEDLYIEKMDAITGATISSEAVIDSVREKVKAVVSGREILRASPSE